MVRQSRIPIWLKGLQSEARPNLTAVVRMMLVNQYEEGAHKELDEAAGTLSFGSEVHCSPFYTSVPRIS